MSFTYHAYELNQYLESPWYDREIGLFEAIIDKLPDADKAYVSSQHYHSKLSTPTSGTTILSVNDSSQIIMAGLTGIAGYLQVDAGGVVTVGATGVGGLGATGLSLNSIPKTSDFNNNYVVPSMMSEVSGNIAITDIATTQNLNIDLAGDPTCVRISSYYGGYKDLKIDCDTLKLQTLAGGLVEVGEDLQVDLDATINHDLTVRNNLSCTGLQVSKDAVVTGDVYTAQYQSYSSSLGGWSGMTGQDTWYKKVGKSVYVNFSLQGYGNGSGPLTFTVPTFSDVSGPSTRTMIQSMCNGVFYAGVADLPAGSSQVTCYFDAGYTGFNPFPLTSSINGWIEYQSNS
jgi:hypothetical protein